MTRKARITIEFIDYWLSGTGRAGEGDVDAVAHRDRFDCPAMPMSQIKGQLRESAARLGCDALLKLFGAEGDQEGALAFRGEATIGDAAGRRFANNRAARAQLFRRIASTRINEKGVAAEDMLRKVEVAVPLTVTGTVYWAASGKPDPNWPELLDKACAATLAFGKLKTDGYGRAIAKCEEVGS